VYDQCPPKVNLLLLADVMGMIAPRNNHLFVVIFLGFGPFYIKKEKENKKNLNIIICRSYLF
jgi:hypothetical protein